MKYWREAKRFINPYLARGFKIAKPDAEENKAKFIPALFAAVLTLTVAVVPEQRRWFK